MSGATKVVAGILQGIYDARGELLPEQVVEEARSAGSPLHAYFEWDDALAGEAHRLGQARALIRSVRVVYGVDEEGRNKSVRRYQSVRTETRHVYKDIHDVSVDPLQRRLLLRQCQRDWLTFKAKYEHLEEFMDIVNGTGAEAS